MSHQPETTISVEGKEEEIARLLSEGTAAAALVQRVYARGTVYKVAARVREGGTPTARPEDDGIDVDVENDPEVIDLKKELRRAELERQIEEIKGPSSTETRLLALEHRLEDLEATLEGAEEAHDRLEALTGQSPLGGLRERFACSCGAEGMVAAKVVCTSCGRETSHGWWPSKS